MSADVEHILELPPVEQQVTYTSRDAILYALAVGLGRDPDARRERPYVIDAGRTVPTLASALVADAGLLERAGFPRRLQPVVEQLLLHRPLIEAGSLATTSRIAACKNEGNMLEVVSEARPIAGGEPAFSLRRTYSRRDSGPDAPPLPSRPADLNCELPTYPELRLIARLVGPPEVDDVGESVIFRCSSVMGLICRAVLQTICEFDHTLISTFAAQIVGPLAAGETLRTDMWQEANVISFSAKAVERGEPVVAAGQCILVT